MLDITISRSKSYYHTGKLVGYDFDWFLDQLIWSKLESGRVPSPAELVQIIDSQLEMSGAKTDHSTFVFDAVA
jgi:hypothetical protein